MHTQAQYEAIYITRMNKQNGKKNGNYGESQQEGHEKKYVAMLRGQFVQVGEHICQWIEMIVAYDYTVSLAYDKPRQQQQQKN